MVPTSGVTVETVAILNDKGRYTETTVEMAR
jgi:hypothetical protein